MVQPAGALLAALRLRRVSQLLIDRKEGVKQGRIGEQTGVQERLQKVMANVGRNDPCPCGSRQKYKRCCLPRESAAAVERARAREREEAAATVTDEDDDEASNRVVDLIDAGRLDEAEQAAQDLLHRYPEVHDGLERVAMVAAARGDRARAAE